MMWVRFPLPLRNVEDLLHERGIDVSHETVRFCCNRLGPVFAADIQEKRAQKLHEWPQWQEYLDEKFANIRGKIYDLIRLV